MRSTPTWPGSQRGRSPSGRARQRSSASSSPRREAWESLTETQAARLRDHLGPVPDGRTDGELARQIDLLTVEAQRALVLGQPVPFATREALRSLADVLKTKKNVPAVADAEPTIDGLRSGSIWENVHPSTLDGVRETIAPLGYLASKESESGRFVYTRFLDALIVIREPGDDPYGGAEEEEPAPGGVVRDEPVGGATRREVQEALRERIDHPVIRKLRQAESLTAEDAEAIEALVTSEEVAGSQEALEAALKADPPSGWVVGEPLGLSVRRLVGLEPEAVERVLSGVRDGDLSDPQRVFLGHLAEELAENGVVPVGRLFESPYTDAHPSGLVGVFQERSNAIVDLLREVDARARYRT